MRFPSNWVPPIEGIEESNEVKYVWSLLPAKPVGERLLPPLMMRRGALYVENRQKPIEAVSDVVDKGRSSQERRNYCRRLSHADTVLDTRARVDRRRHKGRESDLSTSIEIEG